MKTLAVKGAVLLLLTAIVLCSTSEQEFLSDVQFFSILADAANTPATKVATIGTKSYTLPGNIIDAYPVLAGMIGSPAPYVIGISDKHSDTIVQYLLHKQLPPGILRTYSALSLRELFRDAEVLSLVSLKNKLNNAIMNRFDTFNAHPSMELDPSERIVKRNTFAENTHASVCVNKAVRGGVERKIAFRIRYTRSNFVMIGVQPRPSLNSYSGYVKDNGNSYYGANGYLYSDATHKAFGPTFSTGDIIGVIVNLQQQTVQYFKNGVAVGDVAHKVSLPGNWNEAYITVNLYTPNDSVEIIPFQ